VTSKDTAEHELFVTLMNTANKHGYK
jgi:hypothetical protein